MKYQMNTTTKSMETLDKFASAENTVFVRIFYNGKFVNYFFDPSDVQNLGLSNIFDSIDPDPDLLEAKANYAKLEEQILEKMWATNKRKKVERANRKQAKLSAASSSKT
jgi:hypothetical protein